MTDWNYIFPFMVLGLCDAFGIFHRGNNFPKYSATMVDPPRHVHRAGVNWFNDRLNDANYHRGRRSLKHSGSAEADANIQHHSTRNSLASKANDHDPTLKDYSSNTRRVFWEPIVDGNIIASIGELFSQNIKDEADRGRIEREKIREKELLEKYTAMLNDPEQYAKLQQEAENSPSFINQTISG